MVDQRLAEAWISRRRRRSRCSAAQTPILLDHRRPLLPDCCHWAFSASTLWHTMAWAIISGVLASTGLTLLWSRRLCAGVESGRSCVPGVRVRAWKGRAATSGWPVSEGDKLKRANCLTAFAECLQCAPVSDDCRDHWCYTKPDMSAAVPMPG